MSVEVRPLTIDSMDDEIFCCLGKKNFENPTPWLAKGIEYKRNWLWRQIDKYGEAGKIAYKDHEPVGFFEYVPGDAAPLVFPERDRCVYICCYDVVTRERCKGVGSALVQSTLKDFTKPHPWFNNKPAKSLKLIAYEKSDWKPIEPFCKMKFKMQTRWLYPGSEHVQVPALLIYDIEAKQRKPQTIKVQLPIQKHLPFPVKVFRSVVCPWAPNFSGAKRVADKFGGRVSFEEIDLWEKPSLTEIYGPNPGTIVNDQWIWASPEEYEEKLERNIREQLKKLQASAGRNKG
jgi:hypothetical protein